MSSGSASKATSLIPSPIRALAFPVTLLVCGLIVTALLPFLGNRDLAYAVFRAREAEREPDQATLEAIREELDLPTTPIGGVADWFGKALRGDFGVSWVNPARPAAVEALSGFGVSATIASLSTLTAVVIATALVLPRLRSVITAKPSKTSHIIAMAVLGSLPEFVLAVTLLVVFSLHLGWFPVTGFSSVKHMVLPVLSLAIPAAGLMGRILLITVDHVAQEEWVRAWRLNKVTPRQLGLALLQRSMAILLPQIVLFFAGTLAATVLIETTFAIPGMGSAAVKAALSRDIPVLQVIVFTALIVGLVSGSLAQFLRGKLLKPLLSSDTAYSSQSFAPTHKPKGGWAMIAVLLPFAVLIVLWFVLPPPMVDSSQRLIPPSAEHIFGTDQLGRDLASRLAAGAVFSLGTAVAVTAVCAVIGLFLGLAGKWVYKLGDALNALPAVLIGVILAGVLGASQLTAAIAVMCVGWIPLAAHCATVVEEVRTTGYYRWAELQGASYSRLLWVHTMPTLLPAVTRHAASRIAHNALALVSLGFLGLGAAHESPNWGVVLSESIRYAERAPWMMFIPTVLLVLLGIASALVTDTNLSLKRNR
jgi:hypothetical protein